jgi:hypothetical protein
MLPQNASEEPRKIFLNLTLTSLNNFDKLEIRNVIPRRSKPNSTGNLLDIANHYHAASPFFSIR